MHIVFLVGSYFPYYTAVSKCIGNITDELAKEHKITIICQKSFNEQNEIDIYNKQKIIRFNTKESKIRNRLITNIKERKGITRILNKSFLNIYIMSRLVKTIFSKVTVKDELVDAYFQALNEINTPIDLIIPSCMPFESVLATINFKKYSKSELKVVPFLFDQFADNSNLHRVKLNRLLKRPKHIMLEREIIVHSDRILAMHSLKQHFEKEFGEFNKTIYYVEHPLITHPTIKTTEASKNIKISYIGGLYKNYVTPNYLLELFSNVDDNNLFLNFYIIGNLNRIVDTFCEAFPQKIANHGSLPKEEADKAAANSDILISIAEKDGIQMSSKIFEYISLGKPIIHFYSVDNDVNLKILHKYPLCLCLKQDKNKLKENIKLFVEFCKRHKDSSVEFDNIKEAFSDALPEYTANLIMELVR